MSPRKLYLTLPLSLALAAFAPACSSTSTHAIEEGDPAHRSQLFGAISALEGRWKAVSPEGEGIIEFKVSSGGSVVRELMFPGEAHEMTNMYSLDGNDLIMTHYCAGGNQPSMRARKLDGQEIDFATAGVRDLNSADEVYMGEMTLRIVDARRVEQHWRAFKGEELEGEMVFHLERID